MVTILLEKILTLLTGWLDAFTEHSTNVLAKLNLIEEDTSNLSDIKDNTADTASNTASVITPINNISSNTSSIKTNTDSIKADTTIIKNNINTISTNTGSTSAYCQDIATNTLDIKDKVVTIASDTTQIRTNTDNVLTDLDKVYEALKWSLVDKITTETVEGTNSVSFNTDLANDLVDLEVDIEATQSGTGDPSPDNVRPIIGVTDKSILVNGNNVTISLGTTVYNGILDVVSGVLSITSELKRIDTATAIYTTSGRGNGIRVNNFLSYVGRYKSGLCNMASIATDTISSVIGSIALGIDNRNLYWFGILDILGFTTLTDMQTWLNNNNVYVLYELESPLEVTLTPSQISTIIGDNTIVTDGDIKATYEESIKHYLDKQ